MLPCTLTLVFLLGMSYFYLMTGNKEIVQLSPELQQRYRKIQKERLQISCQGYLWGFLLSLGFMLHQRKQPSALSFVCTTITISFLTNYFYYMLHPKSDWMLLHMTSQKEVAIWLSMYREMQYNYHLGLVLGMIAVGCLAVAFRRV